MASNTNLTTETAIMLLKGQPVSCPNCGAGTLQPRYTHKNQHTEFKCNHCGEIYHPCKLI